VLYWGGSERMNCYNISALSARMSAVANITRTGK
jgi:hypothetical protein